jgi:hypothetical protein
MIMDLQALCGNLMTSSYFKLIYRIWFLTSYLHYLLLSHYFIYLSLYLECLLLSYFLYHMSQTYTQANGKNHLHKRNGIFRSFPTLNFLFRQCRFTNQYQNWTEFTLNILVHLYLHHYLL